ncbi:MAG TPA: glycosyltransferase family A protein, partial [Saprospiraceae bacterium]|nr:glycosyltransferase family A protein [Saprospiraceae bacterium]
MKETKPFVSIIISSYNYVLFVRDAIESVIHQRYSDFEIIVVDDGSTDGSPEIIAGYGNEITFIPKENGGQASALNAGFKASRGSIIIFLDSDDLLYPDAVANAVTSFAEPEVVKTHWLLHEIDA